MFPLFPLGQIVATPGAIAALERARQPPTCFLARHAIGDWGELEPTDVAENEYIKYILIHGFRLLEQLPDRRRGEAVDNHRSRPVRNAAFARGVLTNCMKGFEGSAGDSGFLRRLLRCLVLGILFWRELAALDVARVYFRVVLPLFG